MEENNLIITEENEKDWKKRFLDFINRFLEIWKRRKDKSSEKSLEDELLELLNKVDYIANNTLDATCENGVLLFTKGITIPTI